MELAVSAKVVIVAIEMANECSKQHTQFAHTVKGERAVALLTTADLIDGSSAAAVLAPFGCAKKIKWFLLCVSIGSLQCCVLNWLLLLDSRPQSLIVKCAVWDRLSKSADCRRGYCWLCFTKNCSMVDDGNEWVLWVCLVKSIQMSKMNFFTTAKYVVSFILR